LAERFLNLNGWEIFATLDEMLELVLSIEADSWSLPDIADWFQLHTAPKGSVLRQDNLH
jgi:prophage maintenance system killer protein